MFATVSVPAVLIHLLPQSNTGADISYVPESNQSHIPLQQIPNFCDAKPYSTFHSDGPDQKAKQLTRTVSCKKKEICSKMRIVQKGIKIIVIVLFIQLGAPSFSSANTLDLRTFREWLESDEGSKRLAMMYFDGITSGMEWTNGLLAPKDALYCPPDNIMIVREQYLNILNRYAKLPEVIEAMRKTEYTPVAMLLIRAMKVNFPCTTPSTAKRIR